MSLELELEQNKAVVRHFVEAIQCQHDLARLDEFFSLNFTDHGGIANPPTLAGAKVFFDVFLNAFPDQHWVIHEQLAEGDKVMTYKTFYGTHLGPFWGMPATGKPVTFNAIDIFTVADGQLTDHWLVSDVLGVMMQLARVANS